MFHRLRTFGGKIDKYWLPMFQSPSLKAEMLQARVLRDLFQYFNSAKSYSSFISKKYIFFQIDQYTLVYTTGGWKMKARMTASNDLPCFGSCPQVRYKNSYIIFFLNVFDCEDRNISYVIFHTVQLNQPKCFHNCMTELL